MKNVFKFNTVYNLYTVLFFILVGCSTSLLSFVIENDLILDVYTRENENTSFQLSLFNPYAHTIFINASISDYCLDNNNNFNIQNINTDYPYSNKNFLVPETNQIVLKPKERVKFNVEVINNNKKGTFWALLLLEDMNPSINKIDKNSTLTQILQYGIMLRTHNDIESFEVDSIKVVDIQIKDNNLNVFISNNSKWFVNPLLSITFFDTNGNSLFETNDYINLYPHQSKTKTFNTIDVASASSCIITLEFNQQLSIYKIDLKEKL